MAIYASLQTTFNQFLLSRIETFLLRFSAFQTMKNHNDTVSVPEVPTSKDSNQTTSDIIESAPTAEETISKPSEYEVLRTNSIAKRIVLFKPNWKRSLAIRSKQWLPI